ncbi:MAG TPA: response regulator [bacterium]|nr:response regulator [bacterium]
MPVRKIRIALIEDSETVRFFYKAIFERNGFEVIEAENAKEGWETICDARPDIIVLDMILPDVSGLELLKKIRSVDFSRAIPVLVLTSVKEIQEVQKILQHGANYYSVKGQDPPDKIQEIIYKLLKRTREKKPDGASENEVDSSGADRLFWFH